MIRYEIITAVLILAAASAAPARAAEAVSSAPVDTVVVVGTPTQSVPSTTTPNSYRIPSSSIEPGSPSGNVEAAPTEARRNSQTRSHPSQSPQSAPKMSSRDDGHKFPWLILALGLAGAAAYAATR